MKTKKVDPSKVIRVPPVMIREGSSKPYEPRYRLHSFYFHNRWKGPAHSRRCDWTYIGIGQRMFGPDEWSLRISFFGFELNFWFNRGSTGKK